MGNFFIIEFSATSIHHNTVRLRFNVPILNSLIYQKICSAESSSLLIFWWFELLILRCWVGQHKGFYCKEHSPLTLIYSNIRVRLLLIELPDTSQESIFEQATHMEKCYDKFGKKVMYAQGFLYAIFICKNQLWKKISHTWSYTCDEH